MLLTELTPLNGESDATQDEKDQFESRSSSFKKMGVPLMCIFVVAVIGAAVFTQRGAKWEAEKSVMDNGGVDADAVGQAVPYLIDEAEPDEDSTLEVNSDRDHDSSSDAPRNCPKGTYLSRYRCVSCPAGYRCPGNKRRYRCTPGYYAPARQSKCIKSRCGWFVPGYGARRAIKCPAGKYSAAGARNCKWTPPGTFTTAGSCAPKNCGPGKYKANRGPGACLKARCGYFAAGQRARAQIRCPVGKYSRAGASACLKAPPGTYTSAGACAPVNCGPGKYQPLAGRPSCKIASCGYYAAGPKWTKQIKCPAGKYSARGARACSQTPAGKFSVAGACSPTPCPAGRYQNLRGQSVCKPCRINTFQGLRGQTKCLACRRGYCTRGGSLTCNKKCPSSSSDGDHEIVMTTDMEETADADMNAQKDN